MYTYFSLIILEVKTINPALVKIAKNETISKIANQFPMDAAP